MKYRLFYLMLAMILLLTNTACSDTSSDIPEESSSADSETVDSSAPAQDETPAPLYTSVNKSAYEYAKLECT